MHSKLISTKVMLPALLPALLDPLRIFDIFFDLDRLTGQVPTAKPNYVVRRPRAALVCRVDRTHPTLLLHPDKCLGIQQSRSRGTGCNLSASPDKPGKIQHSSFPSESWAPASPVNSFTSRSTMSSSISTADTIASNGSPSPGRKTEDCAARKRSWQKENGEGIIMRRSSVLLTGWQRCKLGLSKGSRVEDEGLLM